MSDAEKFKKKAMKRKERKFVPKPAPTVLNLYDIINQVHKYLILKTETGELLYGDEKRLLTILSGTHRNNGWVRSNINLVLDILIKNKLIRCTKAEKFIGGDSDE